MTTMSLSPLLEWERAQPLIAAAIAHEGHLSLTAYGDAFPQADLLDLAVATGGGGYHFHREHRDPGARPVAPERSRALAAMR
jgi:hypothetical protein